MKVRALKLSALVFFFVVLLLTPGNISSCAFSPPQDIFTDAQWPESLEDFAAGKLGVIQPTYPHSLLYAAYRTLENKPLAADEQKLVVSLWKHRVAHFNPQPSPDSPIEHWLETRARVPHVERVKEIETYSYGNDFAFVLSCTDDAFENAAHTLASRMQRFGANNPQIAAWVRAQDQVFENCSQRDHSIPGPAPANFDPLIRADRQYQIAAANFYEGNWDAAISGFRQIASDSASPWHVIAPYLAARALVRESTLSVKDGFDEAAMQQAEAAVKAVLADKSRANIHPAAARLLHFIDFRLHPEQRLDELGKLMQSGAALSVEDFQDYNLLLDREHEENTQRTQTPTSAAQAQPPKQNPPDVTDWLLTFASDDNDSRAHAVARFQQTHSPAWLIAALTKTAGSDDDSQPLITAAFGLKPSSPAYATAMYHALRILTVRRPDEARMRLDSLLAGSGKRLDRGSLNLFYALRFRLARNLDEFMTFAQRRPSAIDDDWNSQAPIDDSKDPHARIAFDTDAAASLNTAMPVAELAAAVHVKSVAPLLRNDLAVATWTRAALLDQPNVATAVAPTAVAAIPELKSATANYQAATTRDARRFAIVFTLLHFPGVRPWVIAGLQRTESPMKIDNFRDNWWCSALRPDPKIYDYDETRRSVLPRLVAKDEKQSAAQPVTSPAGGPQRRLKLPSPPPPFLSVAERKRVAAERAALNAMGAAPTFLASETINWAKAHPDDPRVPEALHLAVRATRYGCEPATPLSKQAFELLHRRYPKSDWTEKTPYYY